MEPLNIEKVREKLSSLGIKGERQEEVLKELAQMIAMKLMVKNLSKMSPEQLSLLKSVPENEIANYLEQNKDKFPKMSLEEAEETSNEVLEEYFKEMGK